MKEVPGVKKKGVLTWSLHTIKPWIPALLLMVFCNAAGAALSVWFALGTKGVIDAATSGDSKLFSAACIRQGLLILAVIVDNILIRHLHDRLTAVIDRDLKKQF